MELYVFVCLDRSPIQVQTSVLYDVDSNWSTVQECHVGRITLNSQSSTTTWWPRESVCSEQYSRYLMCNLEILW
jgi:hypothetical protein